MAIFFMQSSAIAERCGRQYPVAVCGTIATNQCQTDQKIALCCAIATSA
ncbi:MAG: hypothetical protein F6K24_18035 [Okeania sp. SIO2D1]|nr:hypothetical protein [Okeania sp. SIO2D1]